MPRMLRLPSEAQLPKGPRRDFVEELFLHYREAGRPTLRAIAAWIDKKNDEEELGATASIETIRRIMTGAVVPRNWKTVEVVFLALCGIAERDPEQERWEDYEQSVSFRGALKRYWNDALDDADIRSSLPPKPQPEPQRATGSSSSSNDDPWASATPSKASLFDDEPPF